MKLEDLNTSTDENSMTAFYIGLSDLMVLLLVFFLMLISMSKIDKGSFEKIRVGFTGSTKNTLVELAGQLVAAAGKTPVIVQPNAGSPRTDAGGKLSYDASPEEMAITAKRLLDAGVRIIGGCCGTTPLHLAAMSRVVRP